MLYHVAEIRTAEHRAIQDLGISGLNLMRTAGMAAFNVLQQHWPQLRQICVFCGAGNNAGDGYVLARLALQAGYRVQLYSMTKLENLTGDTLVSYQDFICAGGQISGFQINFDRNAVIIDALFGTGLNRQVHAEYAAVIASINQSPNPVLAIDVPSGLQADSGRVMGCAVKADVTVTFIGFKCGLFTGQAADYCGTILLADLGLPDSVFAELPIAAEWLTGFSLPVRARTSHKGHFGHVLLIGGNYGFTGALRLSGEAALRSGAGLVSIATRSKHASLINIGRPELMCHGVEDSPQIQALLDKANVVVIGPGLGQDDWAQAMFSAVVASSKTCVVDADALNLLAKQPMQSNNWILTPHPGEAARLLDCHKQTVASDRFAAVKSLQSRYGGVAVLKGAGSLIASQTSLSVSTTGNPGMATAGMGDVLAGMMGGIAAQGLSLLETAKIAVRVHGLAADALAAEFGERGLLAADLLPKIRAYLN